MFLFFEINIFVVNGLVFFQFFDDLVCNWFSLGVEEYIFLNEIMLIFVLKLLIVNLFGSNEIIGEDIKKIRIEYLIVSVFLVRFVVKKIFQKFICIRKNLVNIYLIDFEIGFYKFVVIKIQGIKLFYGLQENIVLCLLMIFFSCNFKGFILNLIGV